MPYKVIIQNESGNLLPATIYFWSNGDRIGEAYIRSGVAELTDEEVNTADHFTVESDGYYWQGTGYLFDEHTFTLVKKPPIGLYVGLALAGGFMLSKLSKFRL
jgi:hypothetical protein